MFYCAEALLLKKELSFSSHSAVVSQFGQHFAKTDVLPRHLHEWLLLAKDMRMDGDYALISEITPEFAQTQIDHAEEFLKEIESYLNKTT